MKTNELIESGILEAYVMGAATPDEIALVEAHLADPLIKQELDEIEQALLGVAFKLEKNVPESVKNNLDAVLFGNEQTTNTEETRVVPMVPKTINWMARAASVALIVSVGLNLFQFVQHGETKDKLAALESTNTVLAGEVRVVRQDLDFYASISDFFQRGDIKMIKLDAVKDRTGDAMLYMDAKSGKVAIKANHLPVLDNEHQYQLWALVDGKPVDMGVIPNDMLGKDQLAMLKSISGMQAFAITKEPYGGKPSPTLEELVVMGNV